MSDTPFHQPIGTPFIDLQTVDSTNNYALKQVHAGLAQHGLALFGHEQTSGRGQHGKKWTSSPGQNLALSIIINPMALALSHQFQLSACAAVTVNQFFTKYAGSETKIKWPNDLYWKDRKAGGVLIESVIGQQSSISSQQSAVGSQQPAVSSQSSEWKWAVIGIGININQTSFPAELPNPVSLKQITGKDFDPVESAKEICRIFNDQFEKLITGGFDNIYMEYLSHLYKVNETVKLKQASRVFEATIKTVSPSGKLIVQHSIEEEFDFGTIEWII